jgi:hypothetical protein
MVGASVHGLLGVDAELQRSALAADQQRTFQNVEYRTFVPEPRHVVYKRDCEPRSRHLS